MNTMDVGWMNVETANVNSEEGIETHQQSKSKPHLGASYVYKAELTVYDIKGFDIVLGKRWMCDMNCQYSMHYVNTEICIGNYRCEEREECRVHHLPGLCPGNVNEGIPEQAKFMSIQIIQKAEVKHESTDLLEWVCMIQVHHRSDGNTFPTHELLGEFQVKLTEFQGIFGKPAYRNS